MQMTDFDSQMNQADAQIMATFSNVSVYLPGQSNAKPGIFDEPLSLIKVSGGGQIQRADYTLSLLSDDATGLRRREVLTLEFQDGSTQKFTVVNPSESGSMKKFTLEKYDGHHQSKPDIRY
ncbi:MAG: hypothetical protein CENE_02660 [Candidatus Celerinatantimonas neptuna]|nr:MAG: hypothetical protein CENE_02660 [Candidatus Celerinatantimonas neptuna]